MENGGESPRIHRALIERERRQHMKSLFSQLFALLPPQRSKRSLPEMVDQSTAYVKQLRTKLEQYKQVKLQLEDKRRTTYSMRSSMEPSVLNIRDFGSNLEINLTTALNMEFALSNFISILQEEGAEIISTTYLYAGDRIIYTILSQAINPRIGIATSRVHERLKSLIC